MTQWPMAPLDEVLRLDLSPEAVHATETYPIIGIFGFGRGLFTRESVSGGAISANQLFRVKANQFIYSRLKAFEGAFGVVPLELDGRFVSNEFPTFSCDPKRLNPDFLGWFFRNPSAWTAAARSSTGIGARRERLKPEQLLRMTIPLPTLKEQQSLVEYLDALSAKVDEAKHLRNRADNEAAALEASWANALFSGSHAAEWQTRPLGELAEIQSGVTLGRSLSGATVRRPYLRVANVQDGHLNLTVMKEVEIREDESDKWKLLNGDVLLTEGGDWDKLGRGTVWRGEIADCIHQNHIFRVRVDSSVVVPEFLSLQTASPYGRGYFQSASKQTTNLASINQRQLKAFPVLIPCLQEQVLMLKHAAALRESLNLSKDVRNDIRTELAAMIPAVLDQVFNGQVQGSAS